MSVMGGPVSAVPPPAAASASPCLSRHDRTSPWSLSPPAGRFVDVSGPPAASVSTPSPAGCYVQPQLLHYLIQQPQPSRLTSGHGARRTSTAAASSSPNSSSAFYQVDHSRANVTQHQSVGPSAAGPDACHAANHGGSAARWIDWQRGLRPSGAVSFRAVVDSDESKSSAAENQSLHQQQQQQHDITRVANGIGHPHRRLMI